eukprot:TRINITY_DN5548_c0_g1_i1.p1 TRINITY_DN5548_c0_g1~~TRINITY_DN5548_c0_g1_i1.p1  ORF type:complete len:392 (+),score=61.40 TRINITY_DN5548_c0_g1_i1:166-1341(+)
MFSGEVVEPVRPPPKRFSEPLKFLPVTFVWSVILFLYFVYVFQHCLPRMQLGIDEEHVDTGIRIRGQWEFVAVQVLMAMVTICYLRAMFTGPGQIPAGDEHWNTYASSIPIFLMETKKAGGRRYCRWCDKYKPDRAHHCRVCMTCVLRMDHHCPWIYNCVGFFNYKYFFLLIFYAVLACQLIMWTQAETVSKIIEFETPFLTMLMIIFAETIASCLGLLITIFFLFHFWLITNALTTIEFCEKTLSKKGEAPKLVGPSLYSQGSIYRNVSAFLGDNVLTWLLPIGGPSGDGIRFGQMDTVPDGYEDMDATRVGARSKPDKSNCGGFMEPSADASYEDLEATRRVRKSKSACGDVLESLRCDQPSTYRDLRFTPGILVPATSSTIVAQAGDD